MTSFKKKTTNRGRLSFPKGTRPSFTNNQLLISTGIPSLDSILGGGLAIGTVLLIEEDHTGAYAELMLKYFLSEGALCKHSLFVSSRDRSTHALLKTLPSQAKDDISESSAKQKEDNLQIAWRYKNLGQDKVASQPGFCHSFDLSCTMTEEDIQHSAIYHHVACDPPTQQPISRHVNRSYGQILEDLSHVILSKDLSTAIVRPDQNILRIALHSFGSPSWEDHDLSDKVTCLPWFLTALKACVRNAYAVAVLTIPVHLMEDHCVAEYIEHTCDAAIAIESFAGSEKEKNPAFKDYHGLLKVKKLSCVNTICPSDIDTSDLAFKLKRKKFCIEKLHLPPELSETANRTQSDPAEVAKKSGVPLCGVAARTLDF